MEENLQSIRIASGTTCSSSSSVAQKLNGLQDLHECVDELLLLPLVRQGFAEQIHERLVDELLDGSLRLLELCSAAKNSLLQTREALQELQSSMRRGKGLEQVQNTSIRSYLGTRKSVQKAMKRAILSLNSKTDDSASSLLGKDGEAAVFISLLREVKAATIAVFESVFCFICGSRQPKLCSSRSLISKVMLNKRVASKEEQMDLNELAKQDMVLESLIGLRTSNIMHPMLVEQLQDGLKNLDLDIQDLEERLEGLIQAVDKRPSFPSQHSQPIA